MTIDKIRKEIDQIDDQIILLLTQRFSWVAKLKNKKQILSDLSREAEILSKIHSPNIKNVYLEIFRNSKDLLVSSQDVLSDLHGIKSGALEKLISD